MADDENPYAVNQRNEHAAAGDLVLAIDAGQTPRFEALYAGLTPGEQRVVVEVLCRMVIGAIHVNHVSLHEFLGEPPIDDWITDQT